MFGPETFAWFTGLEADKSRAWFHAHRAMYEEAVRGPLEELLETLADELGGGRVKMFRQHRDTRFAKDKAPYKTTTYGIIEGRRGTEAALYAQLSREGLSAATGYYAMAGDQVERFRAAVDDDAAGEALVGVVEAVRAAGLQTWGEALKTAPRGYPKDHPRVALLRHKMLIGSRRLAPDGRGGIGRKAALDFVRTTWDAWGPMVAWLDAHVGPPTLPPAPRR